MKKVKGLVLFLLTVCVLTVMPMAMKMDVGAESTTYCIGKNKEGEYCFQKGYPWDTVTPVEEIIYLQYHIKDGDKVVVYPDASGVELEINAKIADLTINQATGVVVKAESYDVVYVLSGSMASIHGDITKGVAYGGTAVNFNNYVETGVVYEDATVNFVDDVNCLEVYAEEKIKATINVLGAVNTLLVQAGENIDYLVQNIGEDKMEMEDGEFLTRGNYFNTYLTGEEARVMAEFIKNQPLATPAPAANNNASSSSDYDEVPKTGDTTNAFAWLVMAAAFGGAAVFARKRSMI